MKLELIHHWRDAEVAGAPLQMAIDEALFEEVLRSQIAAIRFYRWDASAITVGYFQKTAEIGAAPFTRRFTGGGIVEHGNDVTFALCLPPGCELATVPAPERYEQIHEYLAEALAAEGYATIFQRGLGNGGNTCFQNPVPADLIEEASGEKICGGAQRRSRGAIIHQGSIRLPSPLSRLDAGWIDHFLQLISKQVLPMDRSVIQQVSARGIDLSLAKYKTEKWNHRI